MLRFSFYAKRAIKKYNIEVVMPFLLPDTFSKELSINTQKIYGGYLNKLAAGGYDTVDSLKRHAARVCHHIKELEPGDDDKARWKRRVFISAVFWVLPEKIRDKTNPYSKLYDKSIPSVFAKR